MKGYHCYVLEFYMEITYVGQIDNNVICKCNVKYKIFFQRMRLLFALLAIA